MNRQKIVDSWKTILQELGEDVEREGIKATPERLLRLYENVFYGYRKKLRVMNEVERSLDLNSDTIPITVFAAMSNGMIVRKCEFISHCEHHMVPFSGHAYIGIIPDKKLLGMNKIDKIVKYYAARLQIQERLTSQVADWIHDNITPSGVMVVIKATHFCAELQGDNGDFTTSEVRGIFKENPETRAEFLKFINGK